jgi:hypothetical protein
MCYYAIRYNEANQSSTGILFIPQSRGRVKKRYWGPLISTRKECKLTSLGNFRSQKMHKYEVGYTEGVPLFGAERVSPLIQTHDPLYAKYA